MFTILRMIAYMHYKHDSDYPDRQPGQLQLSAHVPRAVSLCKLMHWEGASGGVTYNLDISIDLVKNLIWRGRLNGDLQAVRPCLQGSIEEGNGGAVITVHFNHYSLMNYFCDLLWGSFVQDWSGVETGLHRALASYVRRRASLNEGARRGQ